MRQRQTGSRALKICRRWQPDPLKRDGIWLNRLRASGF
jgi:hypothetical protein